MNLERKTDFFLFFIANRYPQSPPNKSFHLFLGFSFAGLLVHYSLSVASSVSASFEYQKRFDDFVVDALDVSTRKELVVLADIHIYVGRVTTSFLWCF